MSQVGDIRTGYLDVSGGRHVKDAGRDRAEFARQFPQGVRENIAPPPPEQVFEGEVLGRRSADNRGTSGGQTGQGQSRGGRQFGSEVALSHYAVSAYQSTAKLTYGVVSNPLVDYFA